MLSFGEVFECTIDAREARAEGAFMYAQLRQNHLENRLLIEGYGRAAIADLFDRAELEDLVLQADLSGAEEYFDGK